MTTDENGEYELLVEVDNQIFVTVNAGRRGYLNDHSNDVEVRRSRVTQNIDFQLSDADSPPTGLRAGR